MLKKLAITGAALVFFACSGGDGGNDDPSSSSIENPSSSSLEEGQSSSSEEYTGPVTKSIASFNNQASIFGTYGYAYALKASEEEDLTQFWSEDCPTESQQTAPDPTCQLDKTNAILQNTLTNRYADLHYDSEIRIGSKRAIALKEYNLTEEGDQAALGLEVGESPKDIHLIDGAIAFLYTHSGGAHTFRAVIEDEEGVDDSEKDANFWSIDIPATADTITTTLYTSDFVGNGSLDEVAFDLSQVKKFLWVVEFAEPANTGSLLVYDLKALVE